MHLGCCTTFGKRKNTETFDKTLSESLATSRVHGSRYPARKTIRYSFILYVGGVKIPCGFLPTRFSSNFVLTSITVKKCEISDTFNSNTNDLHQ